MKNSVEPMTSDSWLVFDQSQAQLSFMRYISVGCVVGIIAGFCIGPGKHFQESTISLLTWKLFQTLTFNFSSSSHEICAVLCAR